MKNKCYGKEFGYKVPKVHCRFCKRHIEPGENAYVILLTSIWGDARTSCKECCDGFEIDLSLHKIEEPEEDGNEK